MSTDTTTPEKAPPKGSIKLPGVGPVSRRTLIVGGAAAVVIIGGAYYVRSRRAPASSTPVPDPATGSDQTGTGYVNPNPGGSGGTAPPGSTYTNADWAVNAETRLVEAGWDAQYAATVVGKILADQKLTAEEMNAAQAAVALAGLPPEGSHPLRLVDSAPAPPPPPPPPTPGPPAGNPVGSTPTGQKWVDTAQYTRTNPPWNSTLSGIASHEHTSVSALLSLNHGNSTVVDRDTIRYPGKVRVK